MKSLLLASFILCMLPGRSQAQTVKEVSLSFSEDMFLFPESRHLDGFIDIELGKSLDDIMVFDKCIYYFYDSLVDFDDWVDEWHPNMRWGECIIPIEDNMEFVTFSVEGKEELIANDVVVTPYIYAPIGTSGYDDSTDELQISYMPKDFPARNVIYSGFDRQILLETQWEEKGLLKCLLFKISPFRYDAANKKLYLLTDITLNITLKQTDAEAIQHVEAEASPNEGSIYDLSGRRLNSVPTKGMYIRGGRKVLVK